ncbi:alkaline phosphatase D family protein [Lentisphaerota bacterium WC36G]|nr:alkaline phosphatase D family protein [Lentisphaerae bacterium WC36]
MKKIRLAVATFFLIMLAYNSSKAGLSADAKKYKSPSKRVDLITLNLSGEQSQLNNQLFTTAMNYFYANKKANFFKLSQDKNFKNFCFKNNIKLTGGPLLGDITNNGVKIWLRAAQANTLAKLVITQDNSIIKKLEKVSTKEKDLAIVFDIKDLNHNKKYHYKIYVDNKLITKSPQQFFTTAPQSTDKTIFRIALGSDPHRWGLARTKLFKNISKRNPIAMVMVGDVAVQDRNANTGLHNCDFLLRDLQPPWQKFVAKTPIYTAWDDHDYFDNDKAGVPDGYSYTDKKLVWKTFTQNWANPSYGFGENGEGVFYKATIGACEIFVLDNRYFREKGKNSLLGERQLAWLKKNLQKSTATFKLLVCPTMWSDYVSNGKDSWGIWDKAGREDIFSLIEKEHISGVILLSGDRHGTRGFKIPRPNGFYFYEYGTGCLGGRKGPRAKDTKWTTQLFGFHDIYAFADMTFDTTKNDPEATFNLFREDGSLLYQKKMKLSELTPK